MQIQLFRKRPRFFQIFRQKKMNSIQRGSDSSRSVDSGNQAEGSFKGIDQLSVNATHFLERFNPGTFPFRDQFQTDLCKYPVFTNQRSNIANRSQRDNIQIFFEVWIPVVLPETFFAKCAPKRDEKIKGNPYTSQVFKGKRAV